MKLVMTLLVRNEEDILASNIEYHLNQGVDFIIATDNISEDGTLEILEHYRKKKVLHYLSETEDHYAQHAWVTRMARMACTEFKADWVINNDADEFWWPENVQDLKDLLNTLPQEIHAICAERYNFVPLRTIENGPILDTMTVREKQSFNALGYPLPPKVCHRAYPDVEVEQGNHAVRRRGGLLPAVPLPLTIFHFPMRSYAQFARKIACGGAAYERNAYLDRNVGCTWRMLYEKWKQGELEDYYRTQELNEAEVEQGIAVQRLVRDERLKKFRREKLNASNVDTWHSHGQTSLNTD
jgi:hypothetical protein